MIGKILKFFKKEGEVEEIFFIDDNPELIHRVRRRYSFVECLRVGFDIKSVCEILKILSEDPHANSHK